MKPALLDVNMLLALAWPSHIHHEIAHKWFQTNMVYGWATCPITQTAFVRISSNPNLVHESVMPRDAFELLGEMIKHSNHIFWADDIGVLDKAIPIGLLVGAKQVTDAYLLGLAIHNQGRLVTLDNRVSALLPKGSPDASALCIVPA